MTLATTVPSCNNLRRRRSQCRAPCASALPRSSLRRITRTLFEASIGHSNLAAFAAASIGLVAAASDPVDRLEEGHAIAGEGIGNFRQIPGDGLHGGFHLARALILCTSWTPCALTSHVGSAPIGCDDNSRSKYDLSEWISTAPAEDIASGLTVHAPDAVWRLVWPALGQVHLAGQSPHLGASSTMSHAAH